MTENLYTVDEAAAALRISRPTLYRLMRGGEIGYRKVGKRRKLTQRDIDLYLARSIVAPATVELDGQTSVIQH